MHGPHQLYLHLHNLSNPPPDRWADTGHAKVSNINKPSGTAFKFMIKVNFLWPFPLSVSKFLFDIPEFIHTAKFYFSAKSSHIQAYALLQKS